MSSKASSRSDEQGFTAGQSSDVPVVTVTAELPIHVPKAAASSDSEKAAELEQVDAGGRLPGTDDATAGVSAMAEAADANAQVGAASELDAALDAAVKVSGAAEPPDAGGNVNASGAAHSPKEDEIELYPDDLGEPLPWETAPTSEFIPSRAGGAEWTSFMAPAPGAASAKTVSAAAMLADGGLDAEVAQVLGSSASRPVLGRSGLVDHSSEPSSVVDATDLVIETDPDKETGLRPNPLARPLAKPPRSTIVGMPVYVSAPARPADEDFLRHVVLPHTRSAAPGASGGSGASAGRGASPSPTALEMDSEEHTVISAPPSPETLASMATAMPSADSLASFAALAPAKSPTPWTQKRVPLSYLQLGVLMLGALVLGGAGSAALVGSSSGGSDAAPAPPIAPERAQVARIAAPATTATGPAATTGQAATSAPVAPATKPAPPVAAAPAPTAVIAPIVQKAPIVTPITAPVMHKQPAAPHGEGADNKLSRRTAKAATNKRIRRLKRAGAAPAANPAAKKAWVDPFE